MQLQDILFLKRFLLTAMSGKVRGLFGQMVVNGLIYVRVVQIFLVVVCSL